MTMIWEGFVRGHFLLSFLSWGAMNSQTAWGFAVLSWRGHCRLLQYRPTQHGIEPGPGVTGGRRVIWICLFLFFFENVSCYYCQNPQKRKNLVVFHIHAIMRYLFFQTPNFQTCSFDYNEYPSCLSLRYLAPKKETKKKREIQTSSVGYHVETCGYTIEKDNERVFYGTMICPRGVFLEFLVSISGWWGTTGRRLLPEAHKRGLDEDYLCSPHGIRETPTQNRDMRDYFVVSSVVSLQVPEGLK